MTLLVSPWTFLGIEHSKRTIRIPKTSKKHSITEQPNSTLGGTTIAHLLGMSLIPGRLYFSQAIIFSIILLATPVSQARHFRTEIEIQFEDIDELIYQKRDFDAALEKLRLLDCQQPDNKQKASNLINLISNYSDYDRKPLMLLLDATRQIKILRSIQTMLLSELVKDYPDCKLAGYAHYLLAKIGVPSRIHLVKHYSMVIEKYPAAMFPVSGYRFKLGQKIAPKAQMAIASYYLYLYGSYPKNIKKGIEALRKILKNYPSAKDYNGRNLALSAYVLLIGIYGGRFQSHEFENVSKAKRLCRLLLTKYKNQKFGDSSFGGEIHTVALMRLAELEENRLLAMRHYKRVIVEFPETFEWTKSGRGYYSEHR